MFICDFLPKNPPKKQHNLQLSHSVYALLLRVHPPSKICSELVLGEEIYTHYNTEHRTAITMLLSSTVYICHFFVNTLKLPRCVTDLIGREGACLCAMTLHQHVFMMSGYVLALLRRPPKALGAVVTAVWIVLSVNRDNVAFEARSVRTVILTILALINLSTTVCLHVLLQLSGLPEASPAALALKREVLCMQGQNMATQGKGVRSIEVAVPTLVHLVALVCLCMFLQL